MDFYQNNNSLDAFNPSLILGFEHDNLNLDESAIDIIFGKTVTVNPCRKK